MSQTQVPTCFVAGDYETIDYTPAADVQVYGGDVIVINNGVFIAPRDIPNAAGSDLDGTHTGALARMHGRWCGPKKSGEVLAVNAKLYYDASGNPVGGTAGTGAFTGVSTGHKECGVVTKAAGASDPTVEFALKDPGVMPQS